MPIPKKKVDCPHCGESNLVHFHGRILWFNDSYNLRKLINGELNQFICIKCGQQGWVSDYTTILLDGNDKISFKWNPPGSPPEKKEEEGQLIFREPFGSPLRLLPAFLHEYDAWWEAEGWQKYHPNQTKPQVDFDRMLD